MKDAISALPKYMKDKALEALTDYFRTHYFYAELYGTETFMIYGDFELTKEQILQARALCFGIYYGMNDDKF